MVPRSKLARNLATTTRRGALASRQYATAHGEQRPSITTPENKATRVREKEANSVVTNRAPRIRDTERDERADITAALTGPKS